jgi:hypothetical protein
MNNLLDRICYVTVDPLVVAVWAGTGVLMVVPQLVFNLGSWVSIFMYYSLVDLDHWLANYFHFERDTSPPDPPVQQEKVIKTRAQQYADEQRAQL